jgi:hypothetical protein
MFFYQTFVISKLFSVSWPGLSDQHKQVYVRFEAITAVAMKNVVFWDVALCRSCVDRRFGGKYRLHLQMEAINSSETSVSTRPTQCHIPEDDILHKQVYLKNKTYLFNKYFLSNRALLDQITLTL